MVSVFFRKLKPKPHHMKKYFAVFCLFFVLQAGLAQTPADEKAIKEIMERQIECWNNGDLECFMNSYWKSDQLMFIGSKGLTYGWQKTLDNYKNSYPTKEIMGKVDLSVVELTPLAEDAYFCVGKWSLSRSSTDLSGHFTLLWRKIGGEWVIVADHSS